MCLCICVCIYSYINTTTQVSIHVGKIDKAEEFRYKHVGGLIKPPFTAERLDEIGPLESMPCKYIVEYVYVCMYIDEIGPLESMPCKYIGEYVYVCMYIYAYMYVYLCVCVCWKLDHAPTHCGEV